MNVIRKIALYISIVAFLISLSSASISAGAIIGKVTSIEGRHMELDIGANKGITVGDIGKVYYTVKIEGKDRPIYIANFEVTHIAQRSCVAQIQVRTGDVKVGLFAEILRASDLEVTSAPSGASVHINGKPVGVTPYEGKNLSSGPYKVQVEKEGYEAWEKQITVEAGKTKQVLAELVVLKIGELEVNSEPSKAKIYLDGKGAGETPSVLSKINPGRHRVQIIKDGYVPYEETVEIRVRERAKVEASLKRVTGGILVVVEPPEANIHIDGSPAGLSPYEGKGLTPGKHKVRVDKEGYETWEGEVTVIAEKDIKVPVVLRLKAGELVVQSEPTGAKAYLTGKEIGDTPFKVSGIAPGIYDLRVIKEGYAPHEGQVKIVGGKSETVQVSLRKSVGNLLVRTEPAEANVYIDGKPEGVSPYEGKNLSPGTHKVRVEKEGYDVWEGPVVVEAGRVKETVTRLELKVGELEVRTEPAGANVSIDGKLAGVSPLQSEGLIPGVHRVEVSKEAYETQEKEVIVKANERAVIPVVLKRLMGSLWVRSEPEGATVSIDGKVVGESPIEAKDLAAGTHHVRVAKEGYEIWEKDTEFKTNGHVNLQANLKEKATKSEVSKESLNTSKSMDEKNVESPAWNIGDRWGYSTYTMEVVEIDKDGFVVSFSDGSTVIFQKSTLNRTFSLVQGKRQQYKGVRRRRLNFPLSIGKKWEDTSTGKGWQSGLERTFSERYKVLGWEDVEVKAGRFRALKLEYKQTVISGPWEYLIWYWYSPVVKNVVKSKLARGSQHLPNSDWELVSYSLVK